MLPALDERAPDAHGNTPLGGLLVRALEAPLDDSGCGGRMLTAIAAIVSFLTTPIYEATARLEIEPETPQLQSSSSDVYQKADADDIFPADPDPGS